MPAMDPPDLRRWLERNGYTPDELATAFGVNKVTVWRWLNGKSPISNLVVLALGSLEQQSADRRRRAPRAPKGDSEKGNDGRGNRTS